MQFVFLTFPEVEGVAIRWEENVPKTAELIAAAVSSGFSEWEARESPLGVLEQEFTLAGCVFRRDALALIGINGSTLIEVTPGPLVDRPTADG